MADSVRGINVVIGAETAALDRGLAAVSRSSQNLQNNLQAATSTLQTRMASLGTSLQNIGSTMKTIGAGMTAAITLPVVAVGAEIIKLASDAQEMRSKFSTVFGDSAADAEAWAASYSDAAGRSQNAIMTMMGDFGSVLTGLGMARDEAAEFSGQVVQLAMDLGSFNNMSPEEAFDKISSAMRGESEAAEGLGVAMNEVTIAQQMQSMGLQGQFQDLDEVTKKQVLYGLIVSQSTDALGDAERTSGSFANQMNALKGKLADVGAELGGILLPYATQLVSTLAGLTKGFGELSPTIQTAIVVVAGIAAALGPLLIVVGMLAQGVGTLMLAFAGTAAETATAGAGIAALAGPVGAAVAVIAALSAAIYAVWQDSESFRNSITGAFETISNAFVQVQENINGIFSGGGFESVQLALDGIVSALQLGFLPAWEAVKIIVGGVVSFIAGVMSGIAQTIDLVVAKATELWTSFSQSESGKEALEGVKSAVDGLQQKFSEIKTFLDPIVDKIIEIAGKIGEVVGKGTMIAGLVLLLAPLVVAFGAIYAVVTVLSTAFDVLSAAAGMVGAAFDAVKAAVSGVAQNIISFLMPVIEQVDKVWETIKGNTQTAWEGIKIVVTGTIPALISALGNALQPAVTAVSEVWGDIKNDVAGKWDEISTAVCEAVGLLIDGVLDTFDPIVSKVGEIWEDVQEAIETPINDAYKTVTDVIQDIIDAFTNMVIPHFKLELPHISVTTAYEDVGGVPIPVPSFTVDWYAMGGIFDSPSIIGVGESGPEAVIPLDKLSSIIEKAINRTSNGSITQNLVINSPAPMSAADIARKTRQVSRQLALEWQV